MTPNTPQPSGKTVFDSSDSVLVEFTDTDAWVSPGEPVRDPAELLRLMRERIKYYGSPLPDGYVPPPGIDINALLKQVPWPPTNPDTPPPTA